jgi:hypothetical protein
MRPGKLNAIWLVIVCLLLGSLIAAPLGETVRAAQTYEPLSVVISEVAWAGTPASSADQWIELYNPGLADIDLSGWQLTLDGTTTINLSGTIRAGKFFLLEAVAGTFMDITVDMPNTGFALSATGNVIRLIAPGPQTIDTANYGGSPGSGWQAGSALNYATMERVGLISDGPTAWVSNDGIIVNGHDRLGDSIRGTPGAFNSHWPATPTPTPSSSPTFTSTITETLTATGTYTASPTVTNTPTNTATPSWTASITNTRTPTSTFTRTFTRTATRIPTSSSSPVVINEFLPHPQTDWNGDGVANVGDEYIEIINLGKTTINLQGWKLDNDGFQKYTLPNVDILSRQVMVFYHSVTGISLSDGGGTVRLIDPAGRIVDAFTYPVVALADRTWCRFPDGGSIWAFTCRPSPGNANVLARSATPTPGFEPGTGTATSTPASCVLADTVPQPVMSAECDGSGTGILEGRGEKQFWLKNRTKWDVFVE